MFCLFALPMVYPSVVYMHNSVFSDTVNKYTIKYNSKHNNCINSISHDVLASGRDA